jgi:hypothetical protein
MGAVLRMKPEKLGPCYSRCGTIKIPPCSMAPSAKHILKLFDSLEPHEQFFSYLAAVTITGDKTAKLDLCLDVSLTAFFYAPHLLRHETSVVKVISERSVILISRCRALGEGTITIYFKRFRFDVADTSGDRTHHLPNAKREHYH